MNDDYLLNFILTQTEYQQRVFPPGLEPGTFRVLGERDNHYTTETIYLKKYACV